MLTPAQKHFQQVMAARRGEALAEAVSSVARTAHEQILHQMRMHMTQLSRVKSDQAKAEMKRVMLPDYEGWIDGTLEADSGRQDEVITRLMVWAVDCADYTLALRIGRYVVRHDMAMHDDFKRNAATFLADEICNPVLTLAKTDKDADLSACIAPLDELADIVAEADMPDEVRAKLCKARGLVRRASLDAETQGQALNLLREAMSLNASSGVKREIDALSRKLAKLPETGTTENAGPAEDGGTKKADASADNVEQQKTNAPAAKKRASTSKAKAASTAKAKAKTS
ncbi:phage terminase small subunit [Pantoea agglomerans]|uniref:phage terminase small subunit n=1 Tax=Enterobacter agglomerans TaxID=549 RepID=UPI001558E468|nr:phage terminase small subunit [Pantoea agglomerans]NQS81481.1 terminase [Pantoea agglomerans]